MATPTEQAARAARTGGVTEFADTAPQRADIVITGRFGEQVSREDGQQELPQVAGLAGQVLKRIKEAGVEPSVSKPPADQPPARVPTPSEEDLVEGTGYAERQREAERALTPEGQERFEEAGREAQVATEMPVQPSVIDEPEVTAPAQPEPTVDEVRAGRINQRGQAAINELNAGVVPEGDAFDLLEVYKNRGVIVETDKGIDFNFDNLTSGEDVNNVINATSVIYANPQEAVKRGIIPNVQTVENAAELLADDIGFSRRILRMKVGETLNAEEMTALRVMLQNSGQKLARLSREVVEGDNSNVKLLELRRQFALHAALQMKAKGAQTEIARALQAFRIPVGTQDTNVVTQEMLNDVGGRVHAEDMARKFLDVLNKSGETAANKFAAKAWNTRFGGVLHEIYINGLLSWFTTHFKNFLSTPLFITYNTLGDLAGASIGTVQRGLSTAVGGRPDPRGLYFEDIYARYIGMMQAMTDAWVVASKTFKTEIPTGSGKVEGAGYRQITKENLGVDEMPLIGEFVDYLGRIIRVPGRLLSAQDDFWGAILARGTLYEESVRRARTSLAEGKTTEEAIDDGIMVMIDPRSVSDEIDSVRKYTTLTQDMGLVEGAGAVEKGLGAATRGISNTFLGRFLVPFGRVPTNTMGIVVQNHPLLSLAAPRTRADLLGKNGPKAAQRARGRMAVATGTAAIFYQMAFNGRITGALPSDEKVRNKLPPGWKPWSFVFRGEGFPVDEDGDPLPIYDAKGNPNGPLDYISYQGFEPVSAFIGIAADTVELQRRYKDPAKRMNVISAHVLATMHYFRDLPFLQGIGDIVRSVEYEDPSILVNSFTQNFIGPVPTPYSAAIRNVETAIDPRIKRVSPEVEYYTQEDVIAIFNKGVEDGVYDPVNDSPPLEMVGTVKPGDALSTKYWNDSFTQAWLLQMRSNPWFQETETDYEMLVDVFGNEVERSVPFGVNPVQAMYNSVVPFKYSAGEELTDLQRFLLDLDMPLTNVPESIDGFALPGYLRSRVAIEAKASGNVVLSPTPTAPPMLFQDYLNYLIGFGAFDGRSKQDKINLVKRTERRFYKAAFIQLLGRPENKEVLQAYSERGAIQEALQ